MRHWTWIVPLVLVAGAVAERWHHDRVTRAEAAETRRAEQARRASVVGRLTLTAPYAGGLQARLDLTGIEPKRRVRRFGSRPDGTFQLDNLEPGRYNLQAVWYRTNAPTDLVAVPLLALDIPPGATLRGIEMMVTTGVVVRGHTISDDHHLGVAGCGIEARLEPVAEGVLFGALASDHGAFEFRVPAGFRYRVRARRPQFGQLITTNPDRPERPPFDAEWIDLDLTTPPPTAEVELPMHYGEHVAGQVVDAGGRPVAGALVSARQAPAYRPPAVRTDADGRFIVVGFLPSEAELVAEHNGLRAVLPGVAVPAEQPVNLRLKAEG